MPSICYNNSLNPLFTFDTLFNTPSHIYSLYFKKRYCFPTLTHWQLKEVTEKRNSTVSFCVIENLNLHVQVLHFFLHGKKKKRQSPKMFNEHWPNMQKRNKTKNKKQKTKNKNSTSTNRTPTPTYANIYAFIRINISIFVSVCIQVCKRDC
ncbi:predicted protein [Lodderomyces elongisporus NRRL YB-4239]|uniref:Uncharacterized protein n=1 Tax=Lodderomyces elongisporus (strain ATCC 11503 / CBS 2605 / JCM 1781 / NBRC 1676 / NRRL YB-4239) TaxID=379508 RepID=A5DUB6_LODEL|nr:predicted protein [Lodderomyces elongisporus NRRL YB-4239]